MKTADATFRAFPQFNDPALQRAARVRHRVDHKALSAFTSNRPADRFARALCERRAINVKELLESFEVHARVRRRVRAPHMADLCCGHGLTGIVFALMERTVEHVTLIDRERPGSFDGILAAAVDVAPWVAEKITYHQLRVERALEVLEPGTAVLGVHACGGRTDRCLDVDIALGGPIAVMPCCHARSACGAPGAVREGLGVELASDVDRTYRLCAAGYHVDWSAIPRAITPMNRILVAWSGPDDGRAR